MVSLENSESSVKGLPPKYWKIVFILNYLNYLEPKKLNVDKSVSEDEESSLNEETNIINQIKDANLEKYIQPHQSELDFLELSDPKKISELKIEASKTLIEAQKEIKKLEVEFLINEEKIESNIFYLF